MADDPTQVPTQTSPDVLSQLAPYLALLQQGQAQPQRDMTPVEQDWRSKLGEALGGPVMMPNMTPAERQASGLMALRHFGLGMLGAVGHMQGGTIGSLLGAGFEGAERGALGAQQFDASTLAAQQEYAQKQQELRIAAIKEAIPLLSLQQSQQRLGALGALPPAIGAGTTPNIATGGSIAGQPTGGNPLLGGLPSPPELTTVAAPGGAKFQVAATAAEKFQGLVSDLEAAGYKIDPSTSGGYNKRFIAGTQVPSEHAYGDAIDINSARNPQGGSVSDIPPDLARSLAAKHGLVWGGDWTGKTRDPMHFELPHKTAAPGTVQTAGPGVPTGSPPAPTTDLTGPRPLPPTGPGAGVTTPASIANTPVQTAQAQSLPPAGGTVTPPAPTAPAGPPEFTYVPRPPPPGTIQGGDLTGAEQSVVQDARNSYAVAIRAASLIPDAAKAAEARAQAEATLQATLDKELTARTGRTDAGAKQLTDWYSADFKQQQDIHKLAVDAFYKNQDAQTAQANALALERAKGEEARQTGAAASENSYVLDERKRFGQERDSARSNIDDLQMLSALSQAAGTSTPLENIRVGDKSGRDFMVQWNLGTEAAQKKWGAQQAFEAAVNKTVTGLRAGVSMGQLSDRDMVFLQHMAPSLLQSPQTRADIIAYLEQAQYRKLQYSDAVEQLWDGGKGMSWGKAKVAAQQNLPDYVPKVPDGFGTWDAPTRQQWLQGNARPGSLLRGPDGRLSIYQPKDAK